MTQDSVLVTYVVTGFSHGDLTNALGNGLPEADYDTVVGTYAISDTDLVYYNGGHEFVEIIKIEPLFMFEKIYPDGDIMDCMYVDNVCTKARFRGEKKWTIYKK